MTGQALPIGNRILGPCRSLYLSILGFAIFSYGAVEPLTLSIVGILLALLTLVTLPIKIENAAIWRVWLLVGLCFAAVTTFAWMQSVRMPNHPFENPAWKTVRDHLGSVDGALSIGPEQTRSAIVAFSPFLSFLAALTLFQRHDDAFRMLRRLSYLGAAVAVFGILQHILFPTSLLFARKEFYLGSLTATFVNRNSAGTFFGAGVILSLGFVFYYLRAIDPMKIVQSVLGGARASKPEYRQFTIFFLLAFVQAIALFLTQSRGAVGATFIAIVVLVVLSAQHRLSQGRDLALTAKTARYLRLGGILIAVVGAFALFAGRATLRLETSNDESRLCVFRSTLHAIRDHWPFGSGFGTFVNVFPAYRTAECAGSNGVWEAAHNSFLEGALGMGLVFVVVVAVLCTMLIRTFLRGRSERRRYRFASVAGLSLLVLIGLHSLVDFSMQIPGVSLYVGTIFACYIAIALGRDTGRQIPLPEHATRPALRPTPA
ncbi:MAG: hypothetical protein JWM36_4063 [Hyphomicrobiales bacterium]|nr:hypothetical protein [Hyphomicrobiales bacterium]